MNATIEFPIDLERLSPDQIRWLAAESGRTGKPVNEVALDLIRAAAVRSSGRPTVPPMPTTSGKAA